MKTFYHITVLKDHERTHQEGTKLVCSICEKNFSASSSLRVHMKLHKGEKSHICTFCSKSFVEKTALKKHERKHNNEKHFSCTDCGRTFKYASSVSNHKRTHAQGRKQYSCSQEEEEHINSTKNEKTSDIANRNIKEEVKEHMYSIKDEDTDYECPGAEIPMNTLTLIDDWLNSHS